MEPVQHLVSIDDISLEEMDALFRAADRFAANPRGFADVGPGLIAASLFYEPSTRTKSRHTSMISRTNLRRAVG